MLEHVRDRAIESGAGKVVVACCDKEIKIFLEKFYQMFCLKKYCLLKKSMLGLEIMLI